MEIKIILGVLIEDNGSCFIINHLRSAWFKLDVYVLIQKWCNLLMIF